MSAVPGGRRSRRDRGRAPIKSGLDDHLLYPADRAAVVRLVCGVCDHPLVEFSRSMVIGVSGITNVAEVIDDGAVFHGNSIPKGAAMYCAGPDSDPEQRYAFDCGCGRVDVIVTRAKIEQATAELLDICRQDDTPRTVKVSL